LIYIRVLQFTFTWVASVNIYWLKQLKTTISNGIGRARCVNFDSWSTDWDWPFTAYPFPFYTL